MSYEYITKYDSPNFTRGRGGHKISEIVIHHWGIDGQSFNNVVNWLCSTKSQVSAHFVVEANKVACLVNHSDTAWHAGNFAHNQISLGIECRPEMSSADLETVCELVANLYKQYGVLKIVGHKDIKATECPGRYYAKLEYIRQRAIEIMNGSAPKPQPAPQPAPSKKPISEIAKEVIRGDWGNGASRKQRLESAGYNYDEVQNEVNRQLNGSTPQLKKSIDTIAREVIRGYWGNGATRKQRLESAGYNYNEVQKRVNELL